MRNLNLLSVVFIVIIHLSCTSQVLQKYNWNEIKEFKFYGRNNPLEKKDSAYIIADVKTISEFLNKSKKSNEFFPKGAQNYANIIFNDSRAIIIQILPGLPAPIRVIEGELFDDVWFKFNEKIAMKWLEYIHQLNEELSKK